MTSDSVLLVLLTIAILIGGPWWLISNAIGRRRARRALRTAATEAAKVDHGSVAEFLVDALGPLSDSERSTIFPLLAKVWSENGFLTWNDVVTQAALARRIERERQQEPETVREDVPEEIAPLNQK